MNNKTNAIDSFIFSTLVCMSNGMYEYKLCYTIFKQGCNILSLDAKDVNVFLQRFKKIEDSAEKITIKTYEEFLLVRLSKMKELWLIYFPQHRMIIEDAIAQLKDKMQKDGIASWPITDSFYIWPWLHIVAIDMDLNCGYLEKISYFKFINEIITCGICKNHYSENLNELIKCLKITTCANALLALHTHIQKNNENSKQDSFIYNNLFINKFYLNKYRKQYIAIKFNYEQ